VHQSLLPGHTRLLRSLVDYQLPLRGCKCSVRLTDCPTHFTKLLKHLQEEGDRRVLLSCCAQAHVVHIGNAVRLTAHSTLCCSCRKL
jgi:hypothetical protein